MQWRFISAPMLLGLCLLLGCPSPSASTWATSWGPTVLNYNTWGIQVRIGMYPRIHGETVSSSEYF